MPERLSYVQYAAKHGLVTDYDVMSFIHGNLRAAHMNDSHHRRYSNRLIEFQAARDKGMAQYKAAIESGEIDPPIQATQLESLLSRACGDPDLMSTQAARRTIDRRLSKHMELLIALAEARTELRSLGRDVSKLDAVIGSVTKITP